MRSGRSPTDGVQVMALCALFLALVWPAIFMSGTGTSEAHDHQRYHLPVIRIFAEQLPQPDLVNYQSATSPGYHLLMAVIMRFISDREMVLQLISSLFALGLVVVVFSQCAAVLGSMRWLALTLTMPLLLSTYVLSGAIWLTTDNAGWLFVALAVGGCVVPRNAQPGCESMTPSRVAGCAVDSACAVLIRQIHLWTVAPVALAALMQWRQSESAKLPLRRWIPAMFALGLPVLIVAWLVWLWSGLTPPQYQQQHASGVNFAVLPMTLALLGCFGIFYLPAFGVRSFRHALRDRGLWMAATAAFVIACAAPTSWDQEAGRWGGAIWVIVKHAPSIGERSIVFPPLAALGGAVLTLGWRAASRAGRSRAAVIVLVALACWAAAQMMNAQAWQRYCEPITLIALAWLAALAMSNGPRSSGAPNKTPTMLGLLGLAALQLIVSALNTYLPMLR